MVNLVRFKNDDGQEYPAWTVDTLGHLGTFTKGAPLSKADISQEGTPFILYGELYTTYGEVATDIVRKTDKSVDKKYYSKSGDVVIPTSGESPEEISTATCVMRDGVILAGDLNIYRTKSVDGRIMSYLLNHQANHKIAVIAQGKSIVHIQAKELEDIEVSYPTDPEEQQKIAALFTEVDNLISAASDEVSALEEAKKSMMQKIFSQEVRFKRDDGTEYPDWDDVPFDDLYMSFPNKNFQVQTTEYESNGKYPIIDQGNNAIAGYTNNKNVICENIPAIIFGDHTTNVKYIDKPFVVGADGVKTLQTTLNNPKYAYYLLSANAVRQEGYKRHYSIQREKVLTTSVDVEEQQKIADFLSSMDDAIVAAKDELAGYQELKKGLLQKMFA